MLARLKRCGFAGTSCRRRDSNPRHADYDSPPPVAVESIPVPESALDRGFRDGPFRRVRSVPVASVTTLLPPRSRSSAGRGRRRSLTAGASTGRSARTWGRPCGSCERGRLRALSWDQRPRSDRRGALRAHVARPECGQVTSLDPPSTPAPAPAARVRALVVLPTDVSSQIVLRCRPLPPRELDLIAEAVFQPVVTPERPAYTCVMPACAACGRANPNEAKICSGCGARVVSDAPVPVAARKVVTVVFSDVSGFTALGERLDPESLQQLVGRWFHEAQRVIAPPWRHCREIHG